VIETTKRACLLFALFAVIVVLVCVLALQFGRWIE
jgi:hypothetical protein